MLAAAQQGVAESSGGYAGILGVTVLTSLGESDLTAVGIAASPGRLVSKMSRIAQAAGCEGVVCSPQELAVVGSVAPGLVRVTPGVRPEGTGKGDQQRVMTPRDAIRAGADYLVVGRPVTKSDDPEGVLLTLASDISSVLQP